LLDQYVEMLMPERFRQGHSVFRANFLASPQTRLMGKGRDLYGLRKDGTEVPIEIGLNPLRTASGDFVLSSVADITERKRAERERDELLSQLQLLNSELEHRVQARTAELSATLREREVLLQEVHHRVKNNLQVISSLIAMQARRMEDAGARGALEECQTRVQAIALIHEQLYRAKDYARIPFAEYTKTLTRNVFRASGTSFSTVEFVCLVDDIGLTVDKAIPCGLILNELVTNTLKHAFQPGQRGTLVISLQRDGTGRLTLMVSDNGAGLPPGLDVQRSASLGMHLIHTLAEQLEAEVRIDRTSGTRFEFIFQEESAA
jgi:two-component sensor histidine kinase